MARGRIARTAACALLWTSYAYSASTPSSSSSARLPPGLTADVVSVGPTNVSAGRHTCLGPPHPPREAPAHLNCTAKRFIEQALRQITRQLGLSGVDAKPRISLAYHFDAGRSQPEGGGRSIPGPVTEVNATVAAGSPDADSANCTAEQVQACAHAAGGLASLEGLGDYLADALENGVSRPAPASVGGLGFGPVASAMLLKKQERQRSRQKVDEAAGFLEVGGGSGAGIQVVCDNKGLASLGGGGGGGAAGHFASGTASDRMHGPRPNESFGGGGGGGMQLFFPAKLDDAPWVADQWLSWSSGGGSGCGTCKATEAACKASTTRVTCGAKMDDAGAVNETLGRHVAHLWRVGVLRRCYESGRLAIIGGGGGGSGGAGCCKAVPTLNFGFSFRAELKPATLGEVPEPVDADDIAGVTSCCPDLTRWNVTNAGQSTSGSGTISVVTRRLSAVDFRNAALQGMPFSGFERGHLDEHAVVDPFARENTGTPPPGGANRAPTLQEMIRQQAKRMGVNASSLLSQIDGPSCALPSWLNGTNLTSLLSAAARANPGSSATKEPEKALKYIFKFNPLQGYLTEGASVCGGWGDWCCVCHTAQWRIACLPDAQRTQVAWFLTEDCCESQLQKNTSSPGYVVDTTPARNHTVAWRPGVGWVVLAPATEDSYVWVGDAMDEATGRPQTCPIIDVVPSSADGERITRASSSRDLGEDPIDFQANASTNDQDTGSMALTASATLRGTLGRLKAAAAPVAVVGFIGVGVLWASRLAMRRDRSFNAGRALDARTLGSTGYMEMHEVPA